MDANQKLAEKLLSEAMGVKIDLDPHLREAEFIVEQVQTKALQRFLTRRRGSAETRDRG